MNRGRDYSWAEVSRQRFYVYLLFIYGQGSEFSVCTLGSSEGQGIGSRRKGFTVVQLIGAEGLQQNEYRFEKEGMAARRNGV